MDNLKIAILRYDHKDRLEYQRKAEFLRLNGVYVLEQCLLFRGSANVAPDEERGILSFDVREQEGLADGEATFNEFDHKKALDELKDCWKDALEGTEFLEAFDFLRNVFVDYELFQAGMTLQLFRVNDKLVEEAGDRFEEARKFIKQGMKDDRNLWSNRHVQYAAVYCGQRANLARELCGLPVSVYLNKLADECHNLIVDCPDFSNVWALLGLVYEFADEKIADSLAAFDRALRQVGRYPFASSIYYWKGKRCENHIKGREISKKAYLCAYELDHKYRITYKRAMVCEKEGDFRTAAYYYRECLRRIERKWNYLDSLEQEYYFKVSVKIGYIYLNELNQTEECIESLNRVLELRSGIEQGQQLMNEFTIYYYNLYGKQKAKEYIALELKRMGVRQIYGYLAKAYDRLGISDKAEEYRNLIMSQQGASHSA